MSDPTLQNLTGALATIAAQGHQHPPQDIAPSQTLDSQTHTDLQEHQQPPQGAQPMQGIQGPGGEIPVKRRPGRPKGSGKKMTDPTTEPKLKRPVGRPRKDGLPAGSVGPKRPGRPRKRPPGSFATGPGSSSPGVFYGPYGEQWPGSISAPPVGALNGRPPAQIPFAIDPTLDRDNWSELSRHRPDIFLHTLVSALSAPNPVSAAGPSVEESFKAHLLSLASNGKNSGAAPPIPTLYSILKTFWLPSSPMYFSLTASASATRTPSEHRFLYWDPQPLVFNGIGCPACNTALINKGRIASGPIKIYDLGKPFFVIGCEYVCESSVCLPAGATEGRKFASTDVSILRSLPAGLRGEFPARILEGAGATPDLGTGLDVWSWRGMGVSIPLWNMVRACIRAGLRKDAILGIIRGIIDGVPDEIPPWAFQVPPHVPVVEPKNEAGPSGQQQMDDDEEEDDDEEDEVVGDLQHEEKDDQAEEFHEAWQGPNEGGQENGVPNPNEQQHQDGQQHQQHQAIPPPPQAVPVPTPAPPPPAEFTHTFAQQPAYIPYTYGQPPHFAYYAPDVLPSPPLLLLLQHP
ncbi:hypothetical protein EUX98_g4754 [Antrodiella citrinella]|uniref:Uncharacterized protein n=1 Tax=Antrodiella citrinella TaxID=2447956 RepID=A0A4S4N149_9APHY|nr:hypothetical protein EUX98_g4754 [Antrodiella citrinella]